MAKLNMSALLNIFARYQNSQKTCTTGIKHANHYDL